MADTALQLIVGSYTATKRPAYSTEIVRMKGGGSHRNADWDEPLATWDVTVHPCQRNSAEYLATVNLFGAVFGSQGTFWFHDPKTCTDIEACILDDELTITPVGNLEEISFAVEEYR